MKSDNSGERITGPTALKPTYRPLRFIIGILALISVLLVARSLLHNVSPPGPAAQGPDNAPRLASEAPTPSALTRPHRQVATGPGARSPQPRYEQPAPTPAMQRLVDSVANPDLSNGLTPEQAALWKTNFQALIQQGANAIPAISEFLAKNVDLAFSPADRTALGYSSVRAALLDALAQIGGPLAVDAMSQTLQTVADPREIAVLGQNLERLDPGVHRQEVLDAAREALSMAAQGNLPGRDVAPLFEALRQFGGENAVADLQNTARQWNFYASMGLAQLPDGAGVPALVQMAENSGGADARIPALEMLAQLASQSSEARTALIDQARQQRLSAYEWNALAPFLAGNQMVFQNSAFDNGLRGVNPNELSKTMISLGNQSFLTAPLGALTLDQIKQQDTLINDLLGVTSDPAATAALQRSKSILSRRLSQIAASGN